MTTNETAAEVESIRRNFAYVGDRIAELERQRAVMALRLVELNGAVPQSAVDARVAALREVLARGQARGWPDGSPEAVCGWPAGATTARCPFCLHATHDGVECAAAVFDRDHRPAVCDCTGPSTDHRTESNVPIPLTGPEIADQYAHTTACMGAADQPGDEYDDDLPDEDDLDKCADCGHRAAAHGTGCAVGHCDPGTAECMCPNDWNGRPSVTCHQVACSTVATTVTRSATFLCDAHRSTGARPFAEITGWSA